MAIIAPPIYNLATIDAQKPSLLGSIRAALLAHGPTIRLLVVVDHLQLHAPDLTLGAHIV